MTSSRNDAANVATSSKREICGRVWEASCTPERSSHDQTAPPRFYDVAFFSQIRLIFIANWKESCYKTRNFLATVDQTSFTPPSIEVLNQLLPAYHFLDFIAQGGMGAVYLAKQVSLDREVAVKILPRELSSDPEFRASFQTEARAMARLNHPNLIGIYDSGDVDGMLYIAMEYVPGKSLYHSSWNKKIDPNEASRIIIAICDGLAHAHEAGIIHRDIKPANILLTPKVEPKIGDFGLAQAIGVKHDGIVMGTPGYTAPEVMSHPEKADRRSDLFAVGVMLHELLTGQKPEAGVVPSQVSKCSADFDLIIQRATHPNPVMRYPDASSMALAIREALKGGSSSKIQTGAPLKAARAAAPMARPATIQKAAAAAPAGPAPMQAPKKMAIAAEELEEEEDDEVAPITPLASVSSGSSSWSYVRNLLIIAGLLVVCVFVYQKLQIHKSDVAKREREYELKQREEDMRRKREAEDEQKRLIANAAQPNTTPTPNVPVEPPKEKPPEPKAETPMESLARLQFELSRGERTEMPIGAKRRGDMDFFLVTEPMTWDAALAFAETHGGHVALPISEDEINLLNSMLKNNETIWLGAGLGGRDQWLMIDGSPWALEKKPGGIGNFATLSHLGNIKASDGNRKLPFILAWHRDGSNTSSLANLLQVTRKSLDSQNPIFPPGTQAMGSRHFLAIMRDMNRAEALALAEQAGAHISALSSKDEAYWVEDTYAKSEAPNGLLLAGEKVNGVWQWSTKEAWTYAKWAEGSPDDDEEATFLTYVPSKGWHNVSAKFKVSGVLLEWSKDAAASSSPGDTLNNATPDVASLITKARDLVIASAKERDDKLAANARSFTWDLDVWTRGLKPIEKQTWQQPVTVIKSLVKENRIPSAEEVGTSINGKEDDPPAMAPGIVKIHTYSFLKQNEIDAAYELRAGKIRDSYVAKLKEMGSAAQKAGQQDLVRQMKSYLEEAEDWEKWSESLLEE